MKNLPKALVFDVFGTCVDWRGSIIREGRALNSERGWRIDWEGLVDAWRDAYQPNMHKVNSFMAKGGEGIRFPDTRATLRDG